MDTTRASLLLRIRDPQDIRAWTEFDKIYRPMLLRFARSRGLKQDDADDVVQHCMSAIHKHIKNFDYDSSRGRFKSWLRTLVNNRVRSLMRKPAGDQQAKTHDFERPQQSEISPEEAFNAIWMEEHLKYCLQQMRSEVEDSSYQAFHRHVIQQCSVDEVCRELDMTPNKIYQIKWRLTHKLREKMDLLLGESEGEDG